MNEPKDRIEDGHPDKKYFESWFTALLMSRSTRKHGCFMRDILRGCKRDLWNEYIRLSHGGEPKLKTIN